MSAPHLIYGLHAAMALLIKNPGRVNQMALLKERHDQKIQQLIDIAEKQSIKINFLTKKVMDDLTENATHQGVILFCHPPKKYTEQDLESILDHVTGRIFLLLLDGVQDPHNLGACLRSAEAAGVHAVIAPKDKSVGLTPAVHKVSSGAADLIPFISITNLVRTMNFLKEKNIWLFGAASDGKKSLYQADFTVNLGLVLGQEGSGLRRLTRETCDELLHIPMQGFISSLNVSVATGVFCFEVRRQRDFLS